MHMADASEIAALMASEGDYEKKISWLKKAIVSVTKQKQEVEAQNTQLQNDLFISQKDARHLKEENLKLHKQILILENELEQERRKSTFGQTMLKGLSSLVTKNQSDITVPEHTGPRARRSEKRYALDLSSTDVEHIVKQNEDLMIQIYEIKNEHEELKKSFQRDTEQHQAELASITHETEDLRSLLEVVTNACDALNSDCSRLKAIVHFCRHFFSIASLKPVAADIVAKISTGDNDTLQGQSAYQQALCFRIEFPTDVNPPGDSLPDDIEEELVQRTVQNVCRHISTLLSGVSVLIVALRNTLPQSPRATVASLRFSEDRLTTLLDANNLAKDRLLYLIKNLEEFALMSSNKESATLADSVMTLLSNQRELLQGLCGWVTMIQNHLPLLVDSCTAYLPPDYKYRIHKPTSPTDVCEVSERDVFVDMVVANANTVLSWIRGSLEGMELLLWEPAEKVLTAIAQQYGEVCALSGAARKTQLKWVIAQQQIWWEGSTALPELVRATFVMVSALKDVAEACGVVQIRDAIKYIASSLNLLSDGGKEGRRLTCNKTRASMLDDGCYVRTHNNVAEKKETQMPECSQESSPDIQCVDQDELLHELEAADRAAVCYYTQMNATLIELAKKEDTIWGLQEELQETRTRLDRKEVEADRMQAALQEQIETLSDQLVALVNTAEPLRLPLN